MAHNQAKGLVCILASPSQSISARHMQNWFETLISLEQNFLDLLHATTYTASDGHQPEWLAVYELKDVGKCEAWFPRLQSTAVPVALSLETLEIRVYQQYSEKESSSYDVSLASDRIFRIIGLQPGPDLSENEYNDWYEEEHVPLLSVVPGWLKSTRWTLRENLCWTPSTLWNQKNLAHYFAIHEWESANSFFLPEFKYAVNTPWREQIIPKLDKNLEERRNFALYKCIL